MSNKYRGPIVIENGILENATGEPAAAGSYLGFAKTVPRPTAPIDPQRPRMVLARVCPDGRKQDGNLAGLPKGSIALCTVGPWAWEKMHGPKGRRWRLLRKDPPSWATAAGARDSVSGPRIMAGKGSPDGIVTAPGGSIWTDTEHGRFFTFEGYSERPTGWAPYWREHVSAVPSGTRS